MIYSEAPEIRSDSPKSPQFLSEEVIVPFSNKKKCTEGVLNALEITQSRMTQQISIKIVQKQKLPQPQQQAKKKCLSCEAWEEWASQSQQSIFMIERKLIQREKMLHDKIASIKNTFEKEKQLFKRKEHQYEVQQKNHSRKIQQLNQTINFLKTQLKTMINNQKFTSKTGVSQQAKMFSQIQQEDEEKYQDIQTIRKVDYFDEPKVNFKGKKHNGENETKLSLRSFHDQNLFHNQKFEHLDQNLVQTTTKLQISPINYQLRLQPTNKLDEIRMQYCYDKLNRKQSQNNEEFQTQGRLQRCEKNERKICKVSQLQICQKKLMKENTENTFQYETQKNSNLKLSGIDSVKFHSKPESSLAEKKQQNEKLSQNQAINVQPVSVLSPKSRINVRQPVNILNFDRQNQQNSIKRAPTQSEKGKSQIQNQDTYKTMKLNNYLNNVEKSRFYQTATQCSFANGTKSRVSNISYKLPNDEVMTLISQCDDKSHQKRKNPERRDLDDNTTKVDTRKMMEDIQKLKFENENLKSYNRVLLQKLSNSRPRKY